MIEITEVRVSLRNDEKLKAFVSITLNDSFVVRGLKIIKGQTPPLHPSCPLSATAPACRYCLAADHQGPVHPRAARP